MDSHMDEDPRVLKSPCSLSCQSSSKSLASVERVAWPLEDTSDCWQRFFSESVTYGFPAQAVWFCSRKENKVPHLNCWYLRGKYTITKKFLQDNTTVTGRNIILGDLFGSRKNSNIFNARDTCQFYTVILQLIRVGNVLSVRPQRWAVDNRTSKELVAF